MQAAMPNPIANPRAWHRRKPRNEISRPLIIAGSCMLSLVVLAALLAPLLSPWGPEEIDFSAFLMPPSGAHPLGTDGNGMDLWSRVLFAARIDIGIAVAAVAIAVISGCMIGGLVGYAGGWIDEIAMRLTDIVQAFPAFVLALIVAAMFGTGLLNLTLAIGLIMRRPTYASCEANFAPFACGVSSRRRNAPATPAYRFSSGIFSPMR